MANQIRFKRASGSDPSASDLAIGEPGLRTDTAELFFKKDDGTIAKVSGGGGGPDFKYLELRNAANNGAASYPGNDFTLVSAGTTTAVSPAAANTLLLSVSGVIQKPNSGTSTSGITGFIVDGSRLKWATNIPAAPDFILYQESGGIGEPSDETVSEAKLKVSNSPVNGYFLSAQSSNTGGLTWAAPVATSCTGNSATATALATARTINGTNFDGTANITVTAAAGTLTGNTLNSSVVTSSLTSLGDLSGLTVTGNMVVDTNTLFVNASTNRVGIGTTSPSHPLDVEVSSGDAVTRIHAAENSSTSEARLRLEVSNDFAESVVEAYDSSGIGGSLKYNHGDNAWRFTTNNDNERMRITSTGLVGIGTTSPETNLHVQGVGDGMVRITSADGSSAFLDLGDASDKDGGRIQYNTDSSLRFSTASSERLRIDSSGNVLIPTNNSLKIGASQDLEIFHSPPSTNLIRANNGDNIRIRCGGDNMISINDSGSVSLSYDGSTKFATLSNGVQITGQEFISEGTVYLEKSGVHHHRILANDTGNDLGFQQSSDTGANTNFTTYLRINDGGDISLPVDNQKLRIGGGADLKIYHDGSNSYIDNATAGGNLNLRVATNENGIRITPNGSVNLYYNNNQKLNTANGGVEVQGDLSLNASGAVDLLVGSTNGSGAKIILDGASNGDGSGGDFSEIEHDSSGNLHIRANGSVYQVSTVFSTNGTMRHTIDANGHLRPNANNTYDLGSSSFRYRNVYTNDLNLSNEGGSNDVDGTWGSYTIQEGAEDLFLVNKRNGKKYKFNLTEVA